MANVETYNTNLTESQLSEAFSRALGDYTDSQINALISAAVAGIGVSASVISSSDENNPTYGTATASDGILITAGLSSNSGVGMKICANTSGEVFICAKQESSTWHSWTKIVNEPA